MVKPKYEQRNKSILMLMLQNLTERLNRSANTTQWRGENWGNQTDIHYISRMINLKIKISGVMVSYMFLVETLTLIRLLSSNDNSQIRSASSDIFL